MLEAAERAGVRVGCAPDTVLGTGIQTARAVLDAGDIGVPVAATAFMVTPGHERWHPAPEFYYRPGGGPLLDMGPYYLTALVTLLGPVKRVVGMSSTPRPTRVIGSGPRAGTEFAVEVETHVTGVLEHEDGALSTLLMSFDVWAGQLPRIEVYGSGGSLEVPDPNGFDGEVRIFRAEAKEWEQVPERGGYRDASRGYGVSDLARALGEGVPHRANGQLAFHVLDVMESLLAAAKSGDSVTDRQHLRASRGGSGRGSSRSPVTPRTCCPASLETGSVAGRQAATSGAGKNAFALRESFTALRGATDPEPLPADSPLYRLPNVFLTPPPRRANWCGCCAGWLGRRRASWQALCPLGNAKHC